MTPQVQQPKIWKPFKRQADFLSLPDTIFEALYGGAAGGGKSETLLMLPVVRQFFDHPRFKALFLRRTLPELDREVIPRSKEIYNAAGLTYQDQKKRWTHASGAMIQFGHCEHEKDVAKYDTSEYNLILFDEATSFTRHQYLYLVMSRCRSSSSNLPAFSRSATNPGGIGHGFFRDRFVKPAPDGYRIMKEFRKVHGIDTELKRIFIPSKAVDNPYLMANDPTYFARLDRLPSKAEREAKLEGNWFSFSGQVFDDWREEPLPGEPINAQHVIEPFSIPSYWPRILSIDWGYSALTVAGWYAINPVPSDKYPAKIYKYREYTCQQTKISTWAVEIKKLSHGEELLDIVLDPSAFGHRGDECSIAEQFAQSFGRPARRANNDRLAGKLLLQEYIRFNPRPIAKLLPNQQFDIELYEKIDRIKGPAAAKEYKELFIPEEAEIYLPKFQVFRSCTETIKAIPLCVYKKKEDLKTESNEEGSSEDVEEFPGDDAYDETRYGMMACQLFLDSGISEHQKLGKLAQIEAELEKSGSLTQYHINMTNFESQQQKSNAGIKLHHNRKRLRFANFR